MRGTVIKNTGSWYTVQSDNGEIFNCKIKGNFRIKEIRTTNPIAVGDVVLFQEDNKDNTGVINNIHERKNYIIRRSSNLSKYAQIIAANIDVAALIVTIKYPETYTTFIDRFLATAEAYNIDACIVINKIDLYNSFEKEYVQGVKNLYETVGYPIFLTSAIDKNSLNQFLDFIKNKTTLISGNSGVGKSTIINQLIPQAHTATKSISDYHKKGVHTTTFSEMYQLPNGGAIIDTPGVKGFGTIDMEHNEVGHYFKEIFYFSKKCKFNNCTHTHEPGCAVLNAVENREISQSRYTSYLSILEDSKEEKYR